MFDDPAMYDDFDDEEIPPPPPPLPPELAEKGKEEDEKDPEDSELASVSDLFSFGESRVKIPCLIIGWFVASITGIIYPVMAYVFSYIFEELGADPADNSFLPSIATNAYILMGLGGGGLVTMTIQNSLLEIAAASMTSSLKTQWFDALLRQDMAYFDIKDIGGSATLISSNASRYRKGIGRKLGEGIQFAVTFLGGFAYAFWASWQTTLITLTILPLMAGTGWFLLKVNQGKTTRENKNYEEAGSVVYSTVSSIKTVLSLNASRKMIVKYKNATQKAHDAAVSFWPIIGLANGSIMGAFLCSYVLLTLYGTYLLYSAVRRTGCDPSDIVSMGGTCATTATDVFGALMGVTMGAAGLPQISAAAEAFTAARSACHSAVMAINRRVGHDNETKRKQIEKKHTISLPKYIIDSTSQEGEKLSDVKGGLTFRGVRFAYPTRLESLVFNGFSLDVEPGKTVALVGPSGGGKSTIVSLIERFYDPTGGSISLDGVDLRNLNVSWLRHQIGLVSQEPVLFAKSIRENISIGCPGATQDEIEDAARSANAHDFIITFPEGYETKCGDKGGQLSGGQKQRIAIARVLLMQPKILLLDEATSALDSESERIVQQALDTLLTSGKRTTIVIAHRLSTIKNADVIAFVDNGQVVETGSHEELMSTKSRYRRLVEAQQRKKAIVPAIVQTQQTGYVGVNGTSAFDGTPQITFQNVHFAYPTRPEIKIFKGLDLTVYQGETLALVGSSGGGKSTVIQLIERFYDPDAGSIDFGGTPLTDLNVTWLRDQLGFVGQEPVLFNCSIGENIRYGNESASQADVEAAARLANCHSFISTFPEGYDTSVGERGTQISGGQKQRIAIARAILKNPRVLLLDEATSALDSESEKLVQEALDNVMRARTQTTIVIAHRLSTVRDANRIAVIENGGIKEIGTHEELMEKADGKYRNLIAMQNLDGKGEMVLSSSTKASEIVHSKESDATTEGTDDEASATKAEMEKKNAQRARLLAKGDGFFFFVGSIGAVLAGIVFPAWGVIFAFMIEVLYKPVFDCPRDDLPPLLLDTLPGGFDTLACSGDECDAFCDSYYDAAAEQMRQSSFTVTFAYLGIIVATVLGNILLFWGFGNASERMNKRVRDSAFEALIRQEPAYFDKHSVGSISTQLQDDAAMIQSFSGEPIRMLVMNLSSVLVGVILSFFYMWPFALLTLVSLPFMGFGAEVEMRTMMGEDEDHSKEDNAAGSIVVETLLNMRTTASLAIEPARSKEYKAAVAAEEPALIRNKIKTGATTGLGLFCQMWCFALWFWWGGFLLSRFPGRWTYRDFLISIFGLMFSLSGLGAAMAGATDREKAKEASRRIFELVDRQTAIDPLSDEGKKDH